MNFKYYKSEFLITFIIALTILFSFISQEIIELLKSYKVVTQINDSIHIISTLSLVTLTITYVNFWGWKYSLFKWLIDIPNLNGRYKGQLISSYKDANGNGIIKECVLEIKQTASSIHVFSYYGDQGSQIQTSMAFSISEEIVKDNDGLFKLFYIYTNEPDTLQTQLNNHSGTTKLKYYPRLSMLEGNYYNQRKNIGTIKVVFEDKKLIGRLSATP